MASRPAIFGHEPREVPRAQERHPARHEDPLLVDPLRRGEEAVEVGGVEDVERPPSGAAGESTSRGEVEVARRRRSSRSGTSGPARGGGPRPRASCRRGGTARRRAHGIVISEGPVSHVYPASRIREARPPTVGAALDDRHVVAVGEEADRDGEAAEAAADDDRAAAARPGPAGPVRPGRRGARRRCGGRDGWADWSGRSRVRFLVGSAAPRGGRAADGVEQAQQHRAQRRDDGDGVEQDARERLPFAPCQEHAERGEEPEGGQPTGRHHCIAREGPEDGEERAAGARRRPSRRGRDRRPRGCRRRRRRRRGATPAGPRCRPGSGGWRRGRRRGRGAPARRPPTNVRASSTSSRSRAGDAGVAAGAQVGGPVHEQERPVGEREGGADARPSGGGARAGGSRRAWPAGGARGPARARSAWRRR